MSTYLLAIAILMFHPLNVESVASISSRKELLCVLFSLLALLAYTAPRRSRKLLAAAFLCQVLAQLSKGSAVMLPLMFLVWELGGACENIQKDSKYLFRRLSWVTPSLLLAVGCLHPAAGNSSG